MKFKSRVLRIVGALTLVCFFWQTTSAYSMPALALFPSAIGKVQASSKAPSGKTVLFLLNAHTSSDAQRNISEALAFLQSQGIGLIGLEGANEKIDGKAFREFPDKNALAQAAWQMVKEGKLTGAEYFYITANELSHFYGLEEKKLYLEDRDAFVNVVRSAEALKGTLESIEGTITALQKKLYSKSLLELGQILSLYEGGDLSFVDYLGKLVRFSKKEGFAITQFPNLYALSKAIEKEKKVNEKGLKKDLEKLRSSLRANEVSEAIFEIASASPDSLPRNDAKDDFLANSKQIHTYFSDLIERGRLNPHEFKQFNHYYHWIGYFSQLDSSKLFDELDALEQALYERLAQTKEEQALVRISESFAIFKKMLAIELTQKEWERISNGRHRESAPLVIASEAKQSQDLGLLRRPDGLLAMTDLFTRNDVVGDLPNSEIELLGEAESNARRFYELAEKRNEIFTKRIIEAMNRSRKDISVIVVGGFHEKGLKAALEKQGISTAVITPKIGEALSDIPYMDRIMGRPTQDEALLMEASTLEFALKISGIISDSERRLAVRELNERAARLINPQVEVGARSEVRQANRKKDDGKKPSTKSTLSIAAAAGLSGAVTQVTVVAIQALKKGPKSASTSARSEIRQNNWLSRAFERKQPSINDAEVVFSSEGGQRLPDERNIQFQVRDVAFQMFQSIFYAAQSSSNVFETFTESAKLFLNVLENYLELPLAGKLWIVFHLPWHDFSPFYAGGFGTAKNLPWTSKFVNAFVSETLSRAEAREDSVKQTLQDPWGASYQAWVRIVPDEWLSKPKEFWIQMSTASLGFYLHFVHPSEKALTAQQVFDEVKKANEDLKEKASSESSFEAFVATLGQTLSDRFQVNVIQEPSVIGKEHRRVAYQPIQGVGSRSEALRQAQGKPAPDLSKAQPRRRSEARGSIHLAPEVKTAKDKFKRMQIGLLILAAAGFIVTITGLGTKFGVIGAYIFWAGMVPFIASFFIWRMTHRETGNKDLQAFLEWYKEQKDRFMLSGVYTVEDLVAEIRTYEKEKKVFLSRRVIGAIVRHAESGSDISFSTRFSLTSSTHRIRRDEIIRGVQAWRSEVRNTAGARRDDLDQVIRNLASQDPKIRDSAAEWLSQIPDNPRARFYYHLYLAASSLGTLKVVEGQLGLAAQVQNAGTLAHEAMKHKDPAIHDLARALAAALDSTRRSEVRSVTNHWTDSSSGEQTEAGQARMDIRELLANRVVEGSVWTPINPEVLKVQRVFGTNGIRGTGFNVDEFRRMAAATAIELRAELEAHYPADEAFPEIGVAVDPRPQGEEGFSEDPVKKMVYARAIAEVLTAFGFPVRFYNEPVGSGHMIATTSDRYLEAHRNFAVLDGTASHNEVVDPVTNTLQFGLKVFKGNAPIMDDLAARISRHINGDAAKEIPQITEVPRLDFDEAVRRGRIGIINNPAEIEFKRLDRIFNFAELGRVFRKKFPTKRIALNTMNGGMSKLAPMILKAMGFTDANSRIFNTTFMNDPSMKEKVMDFVPGPNGKPVRFAPDPTRSNFRGKDYDAYMAGDPSNTIGLLIDGDADRLVLELLGEISPNQIGPIAKYYLQQYLGDKNPNYIDARTVPTTSAMDLLNEALEVSAPKVTDVGSKNFVPFMEDLQIGLEESGHIAFRYKDQVFFDHPVALMLLMMKMMVDTGKTWRELEDEMWAFITEKTGAPRIETSRTGIAKDEGAPNYYPLLAKLPKDEALRQEFGEALAKEFKAQGLDITLQGFDTTAPGGVQFHMSGYIRVMPRKSGTDGSIRFYFESPVDKVAILKKIGTPVMKKVLEQFINRAEARGVLPSVDPTQTNAWGQLGRIYKESARSMHLKELFGHDLDRANRYSIKFPDEAGVLDYSKNIVNPLIFSYLIDLANETGVARAIEMMFQGERINETENRAVLHTALRNLSSAPVSVGEANINVMPEVFGVLGKMRDFSNKINSGEWRGYTGKRITHIVNIGIGGSDLGPVMVTEALKPYATGNVEVRFISNVDEADAVEKLNGLNPETTLFMIASKTFTTQETMTNAQTAKEWFLRSGAKFEDVKKHFVALSTDREKVAAFGIDPENMFPFWDWVGGRYSLWSAIGLSIATYIGFDDFLELLEGAQAMDEHFRREPFHRNIPVILALLSIWYRNFFGAETHAILPYSQYLHRLPAYLQQAFMESDGKSVDRNGNPISHNASSIIWGEAGTNGQHSFYQLIHQGNQLIPADFIGIATPRHGIRDHHDKFMANFFAQTEALAFGKTREQVVEELKKQGKSPEEIAKLAPHKVFKGNNPTNSILVKELDPRTLGMLIVMYEHQIFVEGIIMNVFSFDQWGVQLGKQLADGILPQLADGIRVIGHDVSTAGLIGVFKNMIGRRSEARQKEVGQARNYGRIRMWPLDWRMMSPRIFSGDTFPSSFLKASIMSSVYGGWIWTRMILYSLGRYIAVLVKSLSKVTRILFSSLPRFAASRSETPGLTRTQSWPSAFKAVSSLAGTSSSIRNFIQAISLTARRVNILGSSRIRQRNEEPLGHAPDLNQDSSLFQQFLELLVLPLGALTPRRQELEFLGNTASHVGFEGLPQYISQEVDPFTSPFGRQDILLPIGSQAVRSEARLLEQLVHMALSKGARSSEAIKMSESLLAQLEQGVEFLERTPFSGSVDALGEVGKSLVSIIDDVSWGYVNLDDYDERSFAKAILDRIIKLESKILFILTRESSIEGPHKDFHAPERRAEILAALSPIVARLDNLLGTTNIFDKAQNLVSELNKLFAPSPSSRPATETPAGRSEARTERTELLDRIKKAWGFALSRSTADNIWRGVSIEAQVVYQNLSRHLSDDIDKAAAIRFLAKWEPIIRNLSAEARARSESRTKDSTSSKELRGPKLIAIFAGGVIALALVFILVGPVQKSSEETFKPTEDLIPEANAPPETVVNVKPDGKATIFTRLISRAYTGIEIDKEHSGPVSKDGDLSRIVIKSAPALNGADSIFVKYPQGSHRPKEVGAVYREVGGVEKLVVTSKIDPKTGIAVIQIPAGIASAQLLYLYVLDPTLEGTAPVYYPEIFLQQGEPRPEPEGPIVTNHPAGGGSGSAAFVTTVISRTTTNTTSKTSPAATKAGGRSEVREKQGSAAEKQHLLVVHISDYLDDVAEKVVAARKAGTVYEPTEFERTKFHEQHDAIVTVLRQFSINDKLFIEAALAQIQAKYSDEAGSLAQMLKNQIERFDKLAAMRDAILVKPQTAQATEAQRLIQNDANLRKFLTLVQKNRNDINLLRQIPFGGQAADTASEAEIEILQLAFTKNELQHTLRSEVRGGNLISRDEKFFSPQTRELIVKTGMIGIPFVAGVLVGFIATNIWRNRLETSAGRSPKDVSQIVWKAEKYFEDRVDRLIREGKYPQLEYEIIFDADRYMQSFAIGRLEGIAWSKRSFPEKAEAALQVLRNLATDESLSPFLRQSVQDTLEKLGEKVPEVEIKGDGRSEARTYEERKQELRRNILEQIQRGTFINFNDITLMSITSKWHVAVFSDPGFKRHLQDREGFPEGKIIEIFDGATGAVLTRQQILQRVASSSAATAITLNPMLLKGEAISSEEKFMVLVDDTAKAAFRSEAPGGEDRFQSAVQKESSFRQYVTDYLTGYGYSPTENWLAGFTAAFVLSNPKLSFSVFMQEMNPAELEKLAKRGDIARSEALRQAQGKPAPDLSKAQPRRRSEARGSASSSSVTPRGYDALSSDPLFSLFMIVSVALEIFAVPGIIWLESLNPQELYTAMTSSYRPFIGAILFSAVAGFLGSLVAVVETRNWYQDRGYLWTYRVSQYIQTKLWKLKLTDEEAPFPKFKESIETLPKNIKDNLNQFILGRIPTNFGYSSERPGDVTEKYPRRFPKTYFRINRLKMLHLLSKAGISVPKILFDAPVFDYENLRFTSGPSNAIQPFSIWDAYLPGPLSSTIATALTNTFRSEARTENLKVQIAPKEWVQVKGINEVSSLLLGLLGNESEGTIIMYDPADPGPRVTIEKNAVGQVLINGLKITADDVLLVNPDQDVFWVPVPDFFLQDRAKAAIRDLRDTTPITTAEALLVRSEALRQAPAKELAGRQGKPALDLSKAHRDEPRRRSEARIGLVRLVKNRLTTGSWGITPTVTLGTFLMIRWVNLAREKLEKSDQTVSEIRDMVLSIIRPVPRTVIDLKVERDLAVKIIKAVQIVFQDPKYKSAFRQVDASEQVIDVRYFEGELRTAQNRKNGRPLDRALFVTKRILDLTSDPSTAKAVASAIFDAMAPNPRSEVRYKAQRTEPTRRDVFRQRTDPSKVFWRRRSEVRSNAIELFRPIGERAVEFRGRRVDLDQLAALNQLNTGIQFSHLPDRKDAFLIATYQDKNAPVKTQRTSKRVPISTAAQFSDAVNRILKRIAKAPSSLEETARKIAESAEIIGKRSTPAPGRLTKLHSVPKAWGQLASTSARTAQRAEVRGTKAKTPVNTPEEIAALRSKLVPKAKAIAVRIGGVPENQVKGKESIPAILSAVEAFYGSRLKSRLDVVTDHVLGLALLSNVPSLAHPFNEIRSKAEANFRAEVSQELEARISERGPVLSRFEKAVGMIAFHANEEVESATHKMLELVGISITDEKVRSEIRALLQTAKTPEEIISGLSQITRRAEVRANPEEKEWQVEVKRPTDYAYSSSDLDNMLQSSQREKHLTERATDGKVRIYLGNAHIRIDDQAAFASFGLYDDMEAIARKLHESGVPLHIEDIQLPGNLSAFEGAFEHDFYLVVPREYETQVHKFVEVLTSRIVRQSSHDSLPVGALDKATNEVFPAARAEVRTFLYHSELSVSKGELLGLLRASQSYLIQSKSPLADQARQVVERLILNLTQGSLKNTPSFTGAEFKRQLSAASDSAWVTYSTEIENLIIVSLSKANSFTEIPPDSRSEARQQYVSLEDVVRIAEEYFETHLNGLIHISIYGSEDKIADPTMVRDWRNLGFSHGAQGATVGQEHFQTVFKAIFPGVSQNSQNIRNMTVYDRKSMVESFLRTHFSKTTFFNVDTQRNLEITALGLSSRSEERSKEAEPQTYTGLIREVFVALEKISPRNDDEEIAFESVGSALSLIGNTEGMAASAFDRQTGEYRRAIDTVEKAIEHLEKEPAASEWITNLEQARELLARLVEPTEILRQIQEMKERFGGEQAGTFRLLEFLVENGRYQEAQKAFASFSKHSGLPKLEAMGQALAGVINTDIPTPSEVKFMEDLREQGQFAGWVWFVHDEAPTFIVAQIVGDKIVAVEEQGFLTEHTRSAKFAFESVGPWDGKTSFRSLPMELHPLNRDEFLSGGKNTFFEKAPQLLAALIERQALSPAAASPARAEVRSKNPHALPASIHEENRRISTAARLAPSAKGKQQKGPSWRDITTAKIQGTTQKSNRPLHIPVHVVVNKQATLGSQPRAELRLTVEQGRFNPEAIFADTTPVTPVSVNVETQALNRARNLKDALTQPSLFIELSDEAQIDQLLDRDTNDPEVQKSLEVLFGIGQLGGQKVVVTLPSLDYVKPFNQLLSHYRLQNQIKLPAGVNVTGAYFGNDKSLLSAISQIRTGQAYWVTSLAHANGVAAQLPSFAQAVVGDQFLNGSRNGKSVLHLFQLAAALLLLPGAFRANGHGNNILFGEKSLVDRLIASWAQILEAQHHFLVAA